MINTQNPVRQHWASTRLPAFLTGKQRYPNCTPIWVGRRRVGIVCEGVFSKPIIGSKHIYRLLNGIGFDIESLKAAEKAGATSVEITDGESGIVYRTSLSTIWHKGIPNKYGHEKQRILPLAYWSKGQEPLSEQLELWGER
jgi:hypothetical protein